MEKEGNNLFQVNLKGMIALLTLQSYYKKVKCGKI